MSLQRLRGARVVVGAAGLAGTGVTAGQITDIESRIDRTYPATVGTDGQVLGKTGGVPAWVAGGAASVVYAASRTGVSQAQSTWIAPGYGSTFVSGGTYLAAGTEYDAAKRYLAHATSWVYVTPGASSMWLAARYEHLGTLGIGPYMASGPGIGEEHRLAAHNTVIIEPGLASWSVRIQVLASDVSQSVRDGGTMVTLTEMVT